MYCTPEGLKSMYVRILLHVRHLLNKALRYSLMLVSGVIANCVNVQIILVRIDADLHNTPKDTAFT